MRRTGIAAAAVLLTMAAAQAQAPSSAPVPALVPAPAVDPAAPPASPPATSPPAAPVGNFEAATPAAAPPSTDCGTRAGLYAGPKGLKLWVTRKGGMTRENPLRPITGDQFVILEVVVNNHLASAYGPDYDNMHRAGPPQYLQADGAKIAWDEKADGLPQTFKIIADDGTVVLGPVPFQECGDAPKVAAPVMAKKPRPPAKPKAATAREGRPGVALPQGALPSSALPQGAIP